MENDNKFIPDNNVYSGAGENEPKAEPVTRSAEDSAPASQTVPESSPTDTEDGENTSPKDEQGTVYTYTSSDDLSAGPTVADGGEPYGGVPTVTFDAVQEPSTNASNTGIKVFFSIIAIVVALIIAVSAGFVFGSKSKVLEHHFSGNTNQAGKDQNAVSTSYTQVFRNVDSSVVSITVYNSKGIQGYASGVVYTADGYIITNDHIYTEVAAPMFLVTFNDGTERKAEFIAGDTRSDLAVLKVNANGLKPATFGISAQVTVGEEVIAIGYPSGAAGGSILTSGTVSSASIRFTSTSSYSTKMIQTDTPINPGNSGGALVNMYSQVIGIPSVKMAGSSYDNVGYAIPSDTVVTVVDSLIKHGYVEGRGRLGLSYDAVDSITAELKNIPVGLEVGEISIESDLNNKGIKKGDVITHINDVPITTSDIALDIIEATKPGVTMSFTVYHVSTGKSETVFAELLPDHGNSSYVNTVTEDDEGPKDPFGNGDFDDFFSDH